MPSYRLPVLFCLVVAATAVAPPRPGFAQTAPAEAETASATETVGWLELSGPLRSGPPPFAWVAPEDSPPSLADVLSQLEHVATSDASLGLVVYINGPELSFAQMDAIAAEMMAVRDAGKRVVAFAEAFDLRTYYLAAAADVITLQHKGSVELSGLVTEELYLADMLGKIGVEADLMQVGRYKGADEQLTRSSPSDAWDENIDGLLDDLYAQLVTPIAERRGWALAELEAKMKRSWSLDDVGLLRAGLVDRLADRDMVNVTEIEFGDAFEWDQEMGLAAAAGQAMPSNPFALFQTLFNPRPVRTAGPTVAVVHASGPIHGGESSTADGPFSSSSIGAETITELLDKLQSDDNVRAVVLRLDSPGGSALASEVMWQAMRRFAEDKPLLTSIGQTAASGGYYLAVATDEIYVAPQSILGSIGVVSGKITLGGLYDKLGVGVTTRTRGPLGGMFNSVEPFTDEQRRAVRDAMERIYAQFVDRVEIGRGSRLPDAPAVAEGRLFTGRQAVDNGMADATGTLADAVAAAADRAGLDEGGYSVLHLPRPISFGEYLSEAFGVVAPLPGAAAPKAPLAATSLRPATPSTETAALLRLARTLLGDAAWRTLTQQLDALLLLRDEPTLLVSPSAIVVR